MTKGERRIYCIEGVHEWGDGEIEPTVEPMLELLQRTGYWAYLHRTCGTAVELKYRLGTEWSRCAEGSALYFFTHGARDQIWLQSDDEPVGLLTLKEWIGWGGAEGCHVHFGGCDTFSGGEGNLRDLMEYTGATSVSGYGTEADWLARSAPAVALELLLFGLLKDVNLAQKGKRRSGRLRDVADDIETRFPDCEFKMLIRE